MTMLPPPLQLGRTVTTSICITVAHCHQSTNFSSGPRTLQPSVRKHTTGPNTHNYTIQ